MGGNPATSVDEVLALYERWGDERDGADVTQLDHALQTAALALRAGASDAHVAAGLLHDAGTLLRLSGWGGGRHERTGAAFLAGVFPASVTQPITWHVAAKRYLCAVEPAYVNALSAGSVRSFGRIGGAMSPTEVAAFEATPGWADAVVLRRWDDAAKVEGADVPRLDRYERLLRAVAGAPAS